MLGLTRFEVELEYADNSNENKGQERDVLHDDCNEQLWTVRKLCQIPVADVYNED